jgi:hypothetical protein
VHVFVDDRTPVYGERFMSDYFVLFDAKPEWQTVLDHWQPSSAVVPTSSSVAALLAASPAWTTDYADDQTTLFVPRVEARAGW